MNCKKVSLYTRFYEKEIRDEDPSYVHVQGHPGGSVG